MKHQWKRGISLLLAVVLILTAGVPAPDVSAAAKDAEESARVEGNGTVGTLLADEISKELSRGNSDACISRITIDGTNAVIDFTASSDCELIAAVYTEDGLSMIAAGRTIAAAGTESPVTVALDTESLPDYFSVSAYLLDPKTHEPLCDSYTSMYYTKSIQDLQNSTPEDYDAEKVVRLDDADPGSASTDDSFAVYREETVSVTEQADKNVLTQESNGRWKFEHADASVKNLSGGDIVSCMRPDGFIDAFRVQKITVSGDTVIVTEGEPVGLLDIFECVKIQTSAADSPVIVDTSSMGEGVTFDGTQGGSESPVMMLAEKRSDETANGFFQKAKFSYDHTFAGSANAQTGIGDQTKTVRVNGTAELAFTGGKVEVSLTDKASYVEASIDYDISVSLSASGAYAPEFPFAIFIFEPIPGVRLSVQPIFAPSFTAKISIKYTLSGTIGGRYDGTFHNVSTTPKHKNEFEISGTVFIGFKFNIMVTAVSAKLATMEITAKTGAELSVKANAELPLPTAEKQHTCRLCYTGSVDGLVNAVWKLKILKVIDTEVELLNIRPHLLEFYRSEDYRDAGKGMCPHDVYRVDFKAVLMDEENNETPAEYAKMKVQLVKAALPESGVPTRNDFSDDTEMELDERGEYRLFMAEGTYKAVVSLDNYSTEAEFTVSDQSKELPLTLTEKTYGITFRIADKDGNSKPDTEIVIRQTGQEDAVQTLTSDMTGTAETELLAGTYEVEMQCQELSAHFTITVTDAERTYDVMLHAPLHKITLKTADETGSPIISAKIHGTDEPDPPLTDSRGIAEFYLEDGMYELRAVSADRSGKVSFEVAGSDLSVDCPMFPAQELTVHVTDQNGNPVSGAAVNAVPDTENGEAESADTDANGDAVLHLSAGTYKLHAEAGELEGSTSLTMGTEPQSASLVLSEKTYAVELSTAYYMDRYVSIYTEDIQKLPVVFYDENGQSVGTSTGCSSYRHLKTFLPKGRYLIRLNDNTGSSYNENSYFEWITVWGDCSVCLDYAGESSFTYKQTGNQLFISGYDGNGGNCLTKIPAQYNTSGITSVVIEDGIFVISGNAFDGFSYLESISLPSSLCEIGDYAFANCTSLKSVTVPYGVKKYGIGLFKGCTALEQLSLPGPTPVDFNTTLGLSELTNLTDLTLGSRTISNSGVRVSHTKRVTILDGVKEIGDRAFEGWELENVYLPDTVDTLGTGVFKDCKKLKTVHFSQNMNNVPLNTFMGCSALTEMPIPSSVLVINNYAFSGCTSLNVLEIPDTVCSIGNKAFENTAVKSLVIPDSVESFSPSAVNGCSRLESLSIMNGLESFDINKLEAPALTSLVLDIPEISNCSAAGLSSILLGGRTERVNDRAMIDCTNLTSIEFPEHLTYLGRNVFDHCTSLTELKLPDSVDGCDTLYAMPENLVSVTIPEGVRVIAGSAFKNCVHLETVEFPSTLEEIGGQSFYNCSALRDVEFPENLKVIYPEAFKNCISLETAMFGEKLETIGWDAFMGCSGIKTAVVPHANTQYKNAVSESSFSLSWTFDECPNLESITVGSEVVNLGASDTMGKIRSIRILDTVKKISSLSGCPVEYLEIPDTVLSVASFGGCKNLKKVRLPSSMTSIPYFGACSALEEVIFPDTVTSAVNDCFYKCSSLKRIELPAGITVIPERAFYGCTSLEEVVIPEGMKEIRSEAFYGCTSLKNIMLPSTIKTLQRYAFNKELIETVCFKGKAPEGWSYVFYSEKEFDDFDPDAVAHSDILVFYPEGDSSYTSSCRRVLGLANCTWIPYAPDLFEEGMSASALRASLMEYAAETSAFEVDGILEIDLSETDLSENDPGETSEESAEEEDMTEPAEDIIEDMSEEILESEFSDVIIVDESMQLAADQSSDAEVYVSAFGDLGQKEPYLFAIVKDSFAQELLAPDNLLFLTQKQSEEDGTLSVSYRLDSTSKAGISKLYGTVPQNDLSDAEITVKEMVYTGSAQKPQVTVVYNGNTLCEETDYVLLGDSSVTDAGTYTVTAAGRKNFRGHLTVSCTVQKAKQTLNVQLMSKVLAAGTTAAIKTEGIGTIRYTSGNPEAATVSADGIITAVAPGITSIVVDASGDRNYEPSRKTFYVIIKEKQESSGETEETEETEPGGSGGTDETEPGGSGGTNETEPGGSGGGETGHTHQPGSWTTIKNPTCTASGIKQQKCAKCALIMNTQTIAPLGHAWSSWNIVSGATVFEAEKQSRTCSRCRVSETKSVGTKLTPTIKVSAAKFPLKVGQSTKKLTVSGLAAGDSVVSWRSSDKKYVKVSQSGKITALKKSKKAVTVTVTLASGLQKKIKVTPQKGSVKTTKISGIPKTLTLKKGQKRTLHPVLAPITSVEKITYKTSNKKVVTVTSKGRITAKKKGKATITVKAGKKKVTCRVKVK